MIEKIKKLAKNKNNLVVLVLTGVLLMIIALPVKNKSTQSTENEAEAQNNNNSYFNSSEYDGTGNYGENLSEGQFYIARMEEKLEEVLSQLEGAGKVEVLITLETSEEKIVEKDVPVVRSNTEETDSAGGTRTINNVDMGESTVFSNTGNNSQPYVIKTVSPRIEGVVVLAEGAGNGNVSINISEAVQVLFGIEAHKIKVMKMGGTK